MEAILLPLPLRRRAAAPAALLPDRPAFARLDMPAENADADEADEDQLDEDANPEAADANDDAEATDDDAEAADTDAEAADADTDDATDANDNVNADSDAEAADTDDNAEADADAGGADAAAPADAGAGADTVADADADVEHDASFEAPANADDVELVDTSHAADAPENLTPSPKPQGASRTEGGIFRGCAMGNVFNFGDADEHPMPDQTRSKIMGCVLVYDDRSSDDPWFTMKHEVTPNLKDVLTHLSEKHSPIQSVYLFICNDNY